MHIRLSLTSCYRAAIFHPESLVWEAFNHPEEPELEALEPLTTGCLRLF